MFHTAIAKRPRCRCPPQSVIGVRTEVAPLLSFALAALAPALHEEGLAAPAGAASRMPLSTLAGKSGRRPTARSIATESASAAHTYSARNSNHATCCSLADAPSCRCWRLQPEYRSGRNANAATHAPISTPAPKALHGGGARCARASATASTPKVHYNGVCEEPRAVLCARIQVFVFCHRGERSQRFDLALVALS